jgi:hypothetical protein
MSLKRKLKADDENDDGDLTDAQDESELVSIDTMSAAGRFSSLASPTRSLKLSASPTAEIFKSASPTASFQERQNCLQHIFPDTIILNECDNYVSDINNRNQHQGTIRVGDLRDDISKKLHDLLPNKLKDLMIADAAGLMNVKLQRQIQQILETSY